MLAENIENLQNNNEQSESPNKLEHYIWSRSFHLHTNIIDNNNKVLDLKYSNNKVTIKSQKKSCQKTIGNNYVEMTNPHLKTVGTVIDYIIYKNHLQSKLILQFFD